MSQACTEGRGDHYIQDFNYTWRTLDGAETNGLVNSGPNVGCQLAEDTNDDGDIDGRDDLSNYLPLPVGWVLAPAATDSLLQSLETCVNNCEDAGAYLSDRQNCRVTQCGQSISVVSTYGWGTSCLVLGDGTAWTSANSNYMGTSCSLPDRYRTNRYSSSQFERDRLKTDLVSEYLAKSPVALAYTVTDCRRRILLRCGGPPPPPCAPLSAATDGMSITYRHDPAASPRIDLNIAMYSCPSGFEVGGGDATRKCLDDGSWDGTAPSTCLVGIQLALSPPPKMTCAVCFKATMCV